MASEGAGEDAGVLIPAPAACRVRVGQGVVELDDVVSHVVFSLGGDGREEGVYCVWN